MASSYVLTALHKQFQFKDKNRKQIYFSIK